MSHYKCVFSHSQCLSSLSSFILLKVNVHTFYLHIFFMILVFFRLFNFNRTEKKVMILPFIFIFFFVGFPVSLLLYLSLFCVQLSFYLSDERQVEECNEGGHWKPHPEVQGGVLHCSTICPKSLFYFDMISRYEVYHKNLTRLLGHFVRLCLNLCDVRPSC